MVELVPSFVEPVQRAACVMSAPTFASFVIVHLAFRPGHAFCLPILFRLCISRQTIARRGGGCRTRPELAAELLKVLCGPCENRRFHVLAGSAYGGQRALCHLPGDGD